MIKIFLPIFEKMSYNVIEYKIKCNCSDRRCAFAAQCVRTPELKF